MTLDDKRAVSTAMLASAAPIRAKNVVRKHLSPVKGGQLTAACHPERLLSLLISGMPGEIASGPTVGETSTSISALAILSRHRVDVPDVARRVLESGELLRCWSLEAELI